MLLQNNLYGSDNRANHQIMCNFVQNDLMTMVLHSHPCLRALKLSFSLNFTSGYHLWYGTDSRCLNPFESRENKQSLESWLCNRNKLVKGETY